MLKTKITAQTSAEDSLMGNIPLREILRPFDGLPGIFYIVKDRLSRVIAISPESVLRMGYQHENEVIGKLPAEHLPPELALKFYADDAWVLESGQPRLDMVEMWFTPQGRRDSISTHKYPLHDRDGKVAGQSPPCLPDECLARWRMNLAELLSISEITPE